MPRKKTMPDPLRLPPIPLTHELRARFDELDREYWNSDDKQSCGICGQGRGIPKRTARDKLICYVCYAMMSPMSPTERERVLTFGVDKENWMMRRLSWYRIWFQHSERATLHLPDRERLAS